MVKIDFRPYEVVGLEILSSFMAEIGKSYIPNRLFRGHADKSWKPLASALRPGWNGITTQSNINYWRTVSQRFVPTQTMDDIGYLVLAQHYGIPTTLLDWTSNPLVALFFACEPENQADGAVIQVDTTPLKIIERTSSVSVFRERRAKPLLLDTSAMNVRSTAQDSYMSLHTSGEEPLSFETIFIVSAEDKGKVRNALHQFGMSPARIYADLGLAAEGFKQYLSDEEEYNHLYGEDFEKD